MNKTIFALFFLLFSINCIYSQNQCNTFTLMGTINADTGKMLLMPISNKSYYQYCNKEVNVRNGEFIFTDTIFYPTAYILGLRVNSEWKYLSGVFLVDPCGQIIHCNIDSMRETPNIVNESMREWREEYTIKYDEVNQKLDNLGNLKDSVNRIFKNKPNNLASNISLTIDSLVRQKDLITLGYAKSHPNSYLVLWKLVKLLPNGYKPIYDSIFSQLSKEIKNTYCGLRLKENLEFTRNITVGYQFPKLKVFTVNDQEIELPLYGYNKYILIDFWFSNCNPCLKQFNIYKDLYSKYHMKGFEIIGISIDEPQYVTNWERVIKEQQLFWPQYLDKGKKNATSLTIDYYPSNFLLDANRVIIKKNILPEELEKIISK